MALTFRSVLGSDGSAHQAVELDGQAAGDVWREKVDVVVSKMTEPRRMAKRWRWFAKIFGTSATLGRGTRAAVLMGPGFMSKDEAVGALTAMHSD